VIKVSSKVIAGAGARGQGRNFLKVGAGADTNSFGIHNTAKKTTCCERGKNNFKRGGINIVFGPKYRSLVYTSISPELIFLFYWFF
jgi:hypothetical protein